MPSKFFHNFVLQTLFTAVVNYAVTDRLYIFLYFVILISQYKIDSYWLNVLKQQSTSAFYETGLTKSLYIDINCTFPK